MDIQLPSDRRTERGFVLVGAIYMGIVTIGLFFFYVMPGFFDLLHLIANGEFSRLEPIDVLEMWTGGAALIFLFACCFALTWWLFLRFKKLRRERG